MRALLAAYYVAAFAVSFIVGAGYASGATCTHKSTAACPGYDADNAINGNWVVLTM